MRVKHVYYRAGRLSNVEVAGISIYDIGPCKNAYNNYMAVPYFTVIKTY